ncbi:MAG: heavy-metal-associated domain-containing protein [Actinomycetota bacterium]
MTVVRTRFDVPEITCNHCKASIEGALAPVTGISLAEVDVEKKVVTVNYEPSVLEPGSIVAVIEGQGYDVSRYEEVG